MKWGKAYKFQVLPGNKCLEKAEGFLSEELSNLIAFIQ